ncbi:MAG: cytochrome c maturation protein CcmE [Acidobacteriota bacterium]
MKFIIGGVVIVAALTCLAFVGFQESKAYYITVDEYYSMSDNLTGETVRLAGDVVSGSIDRSKPQMEFVIESLDSSVRVRYVGTDIIPDTFKDGSKALVEGRIAPDGVFLANHIEAKCASKYEEEYTNRTSTQ